jgi:hypothetical protein
MHTVASESNPKTFSGPAILLNSEHALLLCGCAVCGGYLRTSLGLKSMPLVARSGFIVYLIFYF